MRTLPPVGRHNVVLAVLVCSLVPWSGSIRAMTMGIDVSFVPDKFVDSTSAVGTLFYDATGLTGQGSETVQLSGFDIRYFGTFTNSSGMFTSWPTGSTGACIALCSGRTNYVPFEIRLLDGAFNGLVVGGFQRSATAFIENGAFLSGIGGSVHGITFGPGTPGHANATSDNLLLDSFSAPFEVSLVPLPTSLTLLSFGILSIAARRIGISLRWSRADELSHLAE